METLREVKLSGEYRSKVMVLDQFEYATRTIYFADVVLRRTKDTGRYKVVKARNDTKLLNKEIYA